MSRFSKAEAEARGWVFVHEKDEATIEESATQGRTRYEPPVWRAEKYFSLPGKNASLINIADESLGKVLEQIYAFERQVPQVDLVPVPVEESGQVDEAGLPIRNVVLADGVTISDAEFEAREKGADVVYIEGEGTVQYGPSPEAAEAIEASRVLAREAEDEQTAEPDVGPTEQVEVDLTQEAIDTPGGGFQGRLVVREGESPYDVAARKSAEYADGSVEPGPQIYESEVEVPLTDEQKAQAEEPALLPGGVEPPPEEQDSSEEPVEEPEAPEEPQPEESDSED